MSAVNAALQPVKANGAHDGHRFSKQMFGWLVHPPHPRQIHAFTPIKPKRLSFNSIDRKHVFLRPSFLAMSSSPLQDVISEPLVYDGVIFDMDGTLSVSCIDYQLMRSSIDIPVGDLFTVMETWNDASRISRSMDIILDIEATAAAKSQGMPGLYELLSFLKQCPNTRVGLVTRNTTQSVDAFFKSIGEEWRDVFDILLTREHKHVKPDKRCLLYFSDTWNIPVHKLLMVGDSTEDVEVGNAAGTATALIAGGGNEVGGASKPPAGAIPSFTIESLHDLLIKLQQRNTPLGWSSSSSFSSMASKGSESDSDDQYETDLAGAPPPGLDFIDWLFEKEVIKGASCSFPRIDASRSQGPLEDDHPGSKVLHLQCGDGALSKLLFSAGVLVVGADGTSDNAIKRGLAAIDVPDLCQPGSLEKAADVVSAGAFECVMLFYGNESRRDLMSELESQLLTIDGVLEACRVLKSQGGALCVEANKDVVDTVLKDLVVNADGGRIFCEESIVIEDVASNCFGGGARSRLIAKKR